MRSGESVFEIYIPLCFYLYVSMADVTQINLLFTFHYASTYTRRLQGLSFRRTQLHSTMLLLIPVRETIKACQIMYLHSTMLLLIPGLTDVSLNIKVHLHSTMLLLILGSDVWMKIPSGIYIPLCFYLYAWGYTSYAGKKGHLHSTMLLLIPKFIYWHTVDISDLHSTMLLLIRVRHALSTVYCHHLHSTMLLLIPTTFRRCGDSGTDLHSTMLLLIRIRFWE